MTLRERFESLNAQSVGVGGTKPRNYLIQRLQFHADFHFNENWQLLVHVEDDRAFRTEKIIPVMLEGYAVEVQ
ncbi:alginate export family protein [Bradyrhizobium sp. 6(2017)]|uniref:alginate export family protein n=1 Tax=Bradyrhizobium sp. 6(2017) TaxID=1197460 RepID=UPI002FE627BA